MDIQKGARYRYTVENFEGEIFDYLRKNYDYSSRAVKSVKREGELLLNGKHAKFIDLCRSKDVLEVIFKPEYYDCEPEDLPLCVLYEDDDVLVVNKPPFMVTHPTKSHQSGTLSNAVYNYYKNKNYIGKIHFVSRLDMDTSGVVIIAKNKFIHHLMQNVAEYKPFDKYYLAIIYGHLPEKSAMINAPIMRSGEGIKRVVDDEGKECITYYEVVKEYNEYSLVRLKLLTGRTHQIRVHLQSAGCHIISDALYGEPDGHINRQALHANEVSFMHPIKKEIMHFVAPLPEDMQNALNKIEAGE